MRAGTTWTATATATVALGACALLSACAGVGTTASPASATDGGVAQPVGSLATASPSASVDWSGVDWKSAAFSAGGCVTRDEMAENYLGTPEDWDALTVQTQTGDVTGDGTPEVLVHFVCPTPTAGSPDGFAVFGGDGAKPRLLGVLGGWHDDTVWQGATATTGGTTVTLSGPTISGDDAYCCPGHWASTTWAWTGSSFDVVSREEALTTQPIRHEALPAGTDVGILRGVTSDGELLVDAAQWFTGDAAVQACAEDGEPNAGWEWCNAYYLRNTDDLVRAVPVAAGASVTVLDSAADPVRVGSVTALAGTSAISDTPDWTAFRITTRGGSITGLEQIYTP